MADALTLDAWLDLIKGEYLRGFVASGGAAVKFLVPQEGCEAAALVQPLRQAAESHGFHFASVDATETKVHMVEQIFHRVARTVPWEDLAHARASAVLREKNYLLPQEGPGTLSQVAGLNRQDIGEARASIRAALRDAVYRDYAMTEEFRLAMMQLCMGRLDVDEVGGPMQGAVLQWLRGELRLMGALKRARIFQKIGRHNARYLLASLAYWLHAAGKGGLVLTIDISRFLVSSRGMLRARGPAGPAQVTDGGVIEPRPLYYSLPAVIDGYEVLRQFVDGTDEMQYVLVLVLAPASFLMADEQRGLRAYDALYLRIWDDVRDRGRANPLAPLVRIAMPSPAQAGAEGGLH